MLSLNFSSCLHLHKSVDKYEKKIKMFPDSSHYKNYNGSCIRYLSKILIKLQMGNFKT